MLALLKIYLNIEDSSKDGLLEAIIKNAQYEFEDITNNTFDDTDDRQISIIIDMAKIKYHRLGVEGVESQSYSGASEKFTDGFPKELNRRIMRYKRLKVV